MRTYRRTLVVAVVVGLAMMVGQARAAIIFPLDCQMGTGVNYNVCSSGGPFGYISLTDSGNSVFVTVDLYSLTLTPYVISLNWNTALAGALPTTNWSVSGGNIGTNSFVVASNTSGYYGRFDIRVTDTSTLTDPLTFLLTRTGTNLDPSFFNTTDELGDVYAVVRTNSYSGAAEGDFYGAHTSVVPEPASLMLLGTGLVGLAHAWRRKRQGK